MARRKLDLLGQSFGKLTVVAEAPSRKTPRGSMPAYWLCRCVCGTEREVASRSLVRGRTRSCGCSTNKTHGGTYTSEYRTWCAMRARCQNANNKNYFRYGGRGIGIDPRWGNFENFLADMGTRPPDTTLERLNNEAGYGPGNCVWATVIEQANNRRSNRLVTFNGATRTVTQWAHETGLSRNVIQLRLRHGWDVERALTASVRLRKSRSTAR